MTSKPVLHKKSTCRVSRLYLFTVHYLSVVDWSVDCSMSKGGYTRTYINRVVLLLSCRSTAPAWSWQTQPGWTSSIPPTRICPTCTTASAGPTAGKKPRHSKQLATNERTTPLLPQQLYHSVSSQFLLPVHGILAHARARASRWNFHKFEFACNIVQAGGICFARVSKEQRIPACDFTQFFREPRFFTTQRKSWLKTAVESDVAPEQFFHSWSNQVFSWIWWSFLGTIFGSLSTVLAAQPWPNDGWY